MTPDKDKAEKVARKFHDAYERLAPEFGYVTRAETRMFDPESLNGKLMIAVCSEIIESDAKRIEELEAEVRALRNRQAINIVMDRPPGPDSQFIEVELDDGTGIRAGEWNQYGDLWALRITDLPNPPTDSDGGAG